MTNKLANHQTVLLLFGLFLFWNLSFKVVLPGLFFIRIFRVLNTVQSFIFKVQLVASVLSSNSFILSQLVAFVKNFFNFFISLLRFFSDLSTTLAVSYTIPLTDAFCQAICFHFLNNFSLALDMLIFLCFYYILWFCISQRKSFFELISVKLYLLFIR